MQLFNYSIFNQPFVQSIFHNCINAFLPCFFPSFLCSSMMPFFISSFFHAYICLLLCKKSASYLRYLSGRNSSIRIDNMQLKVACWCPSKYSCLKPFFCLSTPLLVLIVVKSRSFLNAHTHFCIRKKAN